MKKLNHILSTALFLSLAAFNVSCDDDENAGASAVTFFAEEFATDENSGTVTLGVSLDNPTTKDIELTVSAAGTATEGEDYTFDDKTITIKAGESKGSFSFDMTKDIEAEEDETIIFTISGAAGLSASGTYTVSIADDDCEFQWIGTLYGPDIVIDKRAPYTGEGNVTFALAEGVYTVSGLGEDWMSNWWGEEVIESVPVTFTINGAGEITIAEQYIMTTLYEGNEYPYQIVGSGQVNTCDGTVVIDYELIQDGFEVGAWAHTNGYMTHDIFKATLSPGE